MMLYAGLRPSEACQLLSSDIKQVDGVDCISVDDSGTGQRIKNINAKRGFHNDSSGRYDEANAELAWQRILGFFNKKLVKYFILMTNIYIDVDIGK
jgi:dienelactone hydrolase